MSKNIEPKKVRDRIQYYSYNDEAPEDKTLVYAINKKKKEIILYIRWLEDDGSGDIDIIFEWFTAINQIEWFSPLWYITSRFQYLLKEKIQFVYEQVQTIKIKKEWETQINRRNLKCPIEIGYNDYLFFHNKFKAIAWDKKISQRICIADFFYQKFPTEFPFDEKYPKQIAKKVINWLDKSIIPYLDKNDIKRTDKFYMEYMKWRYKSKFHQSQYTEEIKIKIDTTTLDEIISEFEKLLSKTTSEADLWKFLKNKIFLTTWKYIWIIPEINVKLWGDREVDFWLLDVWNYLDIYEIKTHKTPLLAASQDRSNYYWHADTVKAIVQAEKYLHHAKKKASDLKNDLKDELTRKWILIPDFKVIEPKAFLIIWHSNQLDSDPKKDDFRILRQWLKNVEIILYDELLETLKNQRKRFV